MRPRRKGRAPVRAGDAQPVVDVALGLEAVERLEVVAHGDALAQLAQAALVEPVAQLGLADQDDLQQLALVGLEVREQPHLLEQLRLEILRLVDQEHDVVAGLGLLEEESVQDVEVRDAVELAGLEAELGRGSSASSAWP